MVSAARKAVDAVDPFMGKLIDVCRERFDARLTYVKAGEFEAGKNMEPGFVWTVYLPPKVRRGNKA